MESINYGVIYGVEERKDLDRKIRIDGAGVHCYSAKQMKKVYPYHSYSIVGKVFSENTDRSAGALYSEGELLSVAPYAWADKRDVKAFVPVGGHEFIAVTRRDTKMLRASFKLFLLTAMLSAVLYAMSLTAFY